MDNTRSGWMRRRRGSTSVEFAVVAFPFVALLLFVFEISYDLFCQEALDTALTTAVRQIATGNAQNAQSGSQFVQNYLCPDAVGLLECNSSLFVRVDKIALSPTSALDYWNYTTGNVPVTGNTLNLAGYGNANFCNAGPTQMLLVSAIYVGPTFIGGLFPGIFSVIYNGGPVHATLATAGVVSEGYPPAGASGTTQPAPPC
jgi:Flp pilus assembly protein TadG